MKEQLANMTIIELVRTAHSYAASIQTIETYSAIVTEMGSRLEALNLAHIAAMNNLRSATSTNDQLAAENAALKCLIAENWNMRDVLRQLIAGRPGGCYFIKWEPLVLKALNETPATDRFLAEQRAQGVEMFASHYFKLREIAETGGHGNRANTHGICAERARDFVAQLRNEVNHG
ncbi:hypothetical protein [Enterobacter sp.]|uniref:hypothetical protein n=1 Tax=Enterobacter sp. TaxID=42895 RepID=UPI002982AA44|nr:hypothetical protein [Enterobacter sp.]